MKTLSKGDQEVLRLLSQGKRDHEVCIELRITMKALDAAVKRIQERAILETEDAGRYYEKALRLRAENRFASLHARFNTLVEMLPQAVLVIDGRTGMIKEANQMACELFGYPMQSLLSISVEELIPEQFKHVHTAYRLGFLSSVRRREMGYHPPIFGVRSDGAKIDMAIALTATPIDDDIMVVCTEHSHWKAPGQTASGAVVAG